MDGMTQAVPLGKLQTVPVRQVWPNEALDFTPWLAREDNIEALGAALGFDLEVEAVEVAVGPYSADILAKDAGSGEFVVIENQLEKTNHDHLGKTITYAAALDASAIVWVATQFTDEHQKALAWLNDHTVEGLEFFAVQLELWSIDGSKPAVKFNVLGRPTAAARQARSAASGELTEVKRLQLEFWTAFSDALVEASVLTSTQTPRAQYWFEISLGRTGIYLSNTANVDECRIGLRVYLHSKTADAAMAGFLRQRQQIEEEIGEPLTWNPHPEKRDKVITLVREADLRNREAWPEYISWMVDRTRKFRRSFGSRAKDLDLSAPIRAADTDAIIAQSV